VAGYTNAANGDNVISQSDGEIEQVLTGHTNVIYDLSLSADGRWLVSCAGDNTAQLWAIKVDGTGDVTNSHVKWKEDSQIPRIHHHYWWTASCL